MENVSGVFRLPLLPWPGRFSCQPESQATRLGLRFGFLRFGFLRFGLAPGIFVAGVILAAQRRVPDTQKTVNSFATVSYANRNRLYSLWIMRGGHPLPAG